VKSIKTLCTRTQSNYSDCQSALALISKLNGKTSLRRKVSAAWILPAAEWTYRTITGFTTLKIELNNSSVHLAWIREVRSKTNSQLPTITNLPLCSTTVTNILWCHEGQPLLHTRTADTTTIQPTTIWATASSTKLKRLRLVSKDMAVNREQDVISRWALSRATFQDKTENFIVTALVYFNTLCPSLA